MPELRLGHIGLGRLGERHAHNLVHLTSGAELRAVCALEDGRVQQVRHALNISGGYTDIHRIVIVHIIIKYSISVRILEINPKTVL